MPPKSSYKRGTDGARVGKDYSTSQHEGTDCAERHRPSVVSVGGNNNKGQHTKRKYSTTGQVAALGRDNSKRQQKEPQHYTVGQEAAVVGGHNSKRQQNQPENVFAVPQASAVSRDNNKRQQRKLNHDIDVLEAAAVDGDSSMRQQQDPKYVTALQQGLEVGKNCDGEKAGSGNMMFGKMDVGCFSQDDLYHRIFHQKPRGSEGNIPWGRVFLRENFQQQWKVYNQNIKLVRSWFSDPDDKFVNSNLRNCKESVAAVKEFIRIREPSLAALLFVSNGLVLHMRWQVDDIYEWFKNHKHYCSRKIRNVPSRSEGEEVGELECSEKNLTKDDCYNQQAMGMEVYAEEEFESQEFRIVKNQEKGHQKRKRIPSSKAMERISESLGKKQKQKISRQHDVEDHLVKVLKEANLNVYQGLQLEALTECSKKTVAMVVMNVERTFDVFPNISLFISETLPEFDIKLKKDDPRQSKIQGLLLDVVVLWALKEFKVGILNPPPLRNGMQQLFLENIKKLF